MKSLNDVREVLNGLHDAVLKAIEFRWAEATVEVTVESRQGRRQFIIEKAATLQCPRNSPWGESKFINEASVIVAGSDPLLEVRIEMQSGDVVQITGESIREKS